MQNLKDKYYDLKACLLSQLKRTHHVASIATQELASELVFINCDSVKLMTIIKQIMYYSPSKSVEWYCEQAVTYLNRQLQSAAR